MMDTTTLSANATISRYNAAHDRTARDMGHGDTPEGLALSRAFIEPLTVFIQTKIENLSVSLKESSESDLFNVIGKLPASVIALCALNGALHAVAHGATELEAAKGIGDNLQGECWRAGLLEQDPALAAKIDRVVRRKHGNLKYRKQAARSIAARAGYKTARWAPRQVLNAGSIFIRYLCAALPDLFLLDGEGREKYLTITDTGLAQAERATEYALRAHPVMLPCTDPLRPWVDWHDGGYWDARSRFKMSVIRSHHKESVGAIRAAINDGSMQPHLDALNVLQGVAWTINERVLGVLKWARDNNVAIDGLPALTDLPMPEKPAAWVNMDEDAQRGWKYSASKVKQRNRTFKAQRVMLLQDLTTADMMAEAGRFWTPMNCDWRGRVYAIPTFNFQRDDRVRALFLFADGQPIGEEGLYWLKVHVANCGDFNKVSKKSIEERVKWTNENLHRIEQMTCVPTKETWWTKADKPFLFLAACLELTSAMAVGSSYLTSLPISFDGSCSGLQHLSAMTRDEATACLVNLTPCGSPQDVYTTVADVVADTVASQALGDGPTALIAQLWTAYFKTANRRKIVKRNVMTYSYSSKKFGMAQQLIEDLMRPLEFAVLTGEYDAHPFGEDNGRDAAKYLAGIVYDTIEALVHKPAQAMAMLQQCARTLAHEGKPVSWTTPLGLPWVNRYHVSKIGVIDLWLHDARVQMKYADGHEPEIDKERAANGVAPNFVHACDAAHLLMVASAAASEDITQLATVHDSFGCLAPQAARFRQIVREQFVRLYRDNNVLTQVLDQCKHDLTIHNQQRLPHGVEAGALNLEEIINADYAFA